MPLFNVEFPYFTQRLIQNLVQIATFDVIDPALFFEPIDMLPESEEIHVRTNFDSTGYNSLYSTVNLGMTFIFMSGMIILSVILVCLKPFKRMNPKLNAKHANMTKSLYWNTYIRFIIEGSLEMFISCSINLEFVL